EWSGNKTTPDAAASPFYRQAIGEDVGNVQTADVPRMNIALPFLDWLKPIDQAVRDAASLGLNHLPIIGDNVDSVVDDAITKGCGVIMNPITQGVILAVDLGVSIVTVDSWGAFAQGIGKSTLIFAGFAGLGQLIQWYISQMAGTGITGTEIGAPRYSTG